MLGLQPQSQQTRCIFQLYPNGRASYHAHHRARPHTRKSTRPDTPSTRPKHFLAKNERLVTPPLGKRGCAPSTALVTTPVIPATGRPHPRSPGRSVTNLSFLAKIAMRRTRRAERCRPGPSQSPQRARRAERRRPVRPPIPASPPPAHAPSERSEQRRPTPPHPPACAASPKTQGSPRPSLERSRRRCRRPREPPEAVPRRRPCAEDKRRGKSGASRLASKTQLSLSTFRHPAHRR